MASIASEIASSSSSLSKWEYDVFLSFRGEDTRNNFTSHLYAALNQKGIWTFIDDERLERGKPISPELLNLIENSKVAIIVLSRNYAFSSWCLDELVKIVECKEKTRLTVLPVFHGVDPSDVRNQRGSFAEAFAKHEELMKNEEKLQSWRAALTQVANLSGWDTRNKKESTIIEEIARKLIDDLHYSYSGVHEDLVGIHSRVEEMENLCLSMGSNDVQFIGIWGMGGIGKTTIARVLYDRILYHFAGSSFLANVREKNGNDGLVALQKQLLSDVLSEKNIDISDVQRGINLIRHRLCLKRVLVILDDVDQDKQLEALAGEQSWFGQGSMIIIITRDQHLLIKHDVAKEKIYNVKKLNDDEALKLFSLKAFKQDNPLEGYEVLSNKFINYAQGLPLALKVLGSSVIGRNLDAWESVLGRLKETPEKEILDVLQISFDRLKTTEKEIFLDIACFFKGMTKYRVTNILQTLHYKRNIEIDELVEKSLITISNGTLWMHDLLQELGKEIVRRESPKELGGRSRLWVKEDVLHVLKYNTGTEKVEGIFIKTTSKEEDLNVEEKVEDLNAETFSKMRNLRLLKICNVRLPQGLISLSSDLRLMDWPEYPLKSMPKNFNPDKLVELIMPRSRIKQLWEGNWSLKWLRIIDLSNSRELIMTLDFARVPNLEKLILKGCTKLSVIHASLGDLKHLNLLDLSNCKCLESLPCKISLESLEIFILSGCSKLKKFPEIVRNMSRLLILYLDGTAIEDLPLSMEQLTGLINLDLTNCENLSSLPRVPNLNKLILLGCTKLSKIHESLGDLKHLILLNLSNCKCLESLPCKIGLESLEIFILSGCSKLKKFPEIVGNMSRLLKLYLDGTAIEDLPLSMEQLTGLIKLDLTNCKNLSSLPRGICSLTSLKTLILSGCSKLHKMEENLGNLKGLKELDMSGTSIRDLPLSIEQLSGLIKLDLKNCKNLSSLSGAICSLTSLKTLTLSGCLKLDNLPMNMENLEGLEELDVGGTAIREPPSSIFCLKNLKILSFEGCNGLASKSWTWKNPLNFLLMTKTPDPMGLVLPSVSGLSSLIKLNIRNCNLQAIPNDIGCLSSLKILDLRENNFVCLPESVNQLTNLREFWVENCKSLQLLPELGLNHWIETWANGCTSLKSLQTCKVKNNSRNYLYLLNCFQLVDLFTAMLREYFQEFCYRESTKKERFDVVIPGSEVPNWFRHRSVGASINLEVPSYLVKQFRGIALCAVFGPPQHRPPNHPSYGVGVCCQLNAAGAGCGTVGGWGSDPVVGWRVDFGHSPFGVWTEYKIGCFSLVGLEEIDIESDHCWFFYLSPNYLRCNGIDFHQIADGSSCQLQIVFGFRAQDSDLSYWEWKRMEIKICGARMEIKKCGAHMVYGEEMEDLVRRMGQSECSSSIIPYNKVVDHFEEDIKSKRSRDDENGTSGEENGASGEGSSTHIPHPKTKRVRPSDGE